MTAHLLLAFRRKIYVLATVFLVLVIVKGITAEKCSKNAPPEGQFPCRANHIGDDITLVVVEGAVVEITAIGAPAAVGDGGQLGVGVLCSQAQAIAQLDIEQAFEASVLLAKIQSLGGADSSTRMSARVAGKNRDRPDGMVGSSPYLYTFTASL